ncbi:Glucose-repressible alcohol dehydrogenase transcriptional effector [Elasticomyces elasticus]|nr:Glucose-repressible alcohol dehydrogenase transcriptional effector [Elasticomyces elasticus]
MADGSYRFQQGAGHYFYQQQNQQAHQTRHPHQRNGSPVNNSRLAFNPSTDTPSPNRSPGTHSPAHNTYGMYGQNAHQQNQHVMLNGGPNRNRYQMQMNLGKPFQHQAHQHQTHHQNAQHHGDGGHSGHGGNFGNHQHNMSSGTLSNNAPHFTPNHLQNGTPSSVHSQPHKPNEHWQEQLRLASQSREMNLVHYHARSKVPGAGSAAGTKKEDDKDDRTRTVDGKDTGACLWAALDFGGQGLKILAPALFNYCWLDKLYINNNKLTYLPPAIGRLRNLKELDLSNNELTDLPAEIGMLCNLRRLYLFYNQLEMLPYEVGSLYQLEMLGIEGNPLNEDLKSIIMENTSADLIRYLREQADVPEPPNDRPWVSLDETPVDITDQSRFLVLSYNILCEKYATQVTYGYTPSSALAWEHRREVVLGELRDRQPDIMCLQEIDQESYQEYFRAALAIDDYRGVFWPKSRAQTMAEKEAKFVDGCATFYKNSKYILLDKQLIEFARHAINRPDMKGEHDIFNRVMPRDDIAVATFLEDRATGARLIVVNVHIFWNPVFKDVKVVQVAILMEHIISLAEKYTKWPPCKDKELFRFSTGGKDGEEKAPMEPGPSMTYSSGADIPLVMCGDFNSTPDSGVYDLIAHGSLSNSHSDLANRNYGNFTRDGMTHPFQLKSSYANMGELAFTNYAPNFIGVIDYIWYSTNSLVNTGLLGEIDKDYLQRVPGFPNYHFPSDHLALQAEFVTKTRKEKKVVEADFGSQRDRRQQ